MSVWERRKESLCIGGSVNDFSQSSPSSEREVDGTEYYGGY